MELHHQEPFSEPHRITGGTMPHSLQLLEFNALHTHHSMEKHAKTYVKSTFYPRKNYAKVSLLFL